MYTKFLYNAPSIDKEGTKIAHKENGNIISVDLIESTMNFKGISLQLQHYSIVALQADSI